MVGLAGLPLPFYKSDTLLLSLGLSWRVYSLLRSWRPDVIHVACPGMLVFAAQLYARALCAPLVMSYHTHIPEYIKSYTFQGLAAPMWALIRGWTRGANLMLVTSAVMQGELAKHACRARNLALWRRGVDVDIFNPEFRSADMRFMMSAGHPEAPLLAYVGRLGAEKNLALLKDVLAANPGARLALVGDGPHRSWLEAHFAGTPTVFTGMLSGRQLSSAFASADIFLMPSETETLGFVVLEAMASGVPVVAVAAGGIPDIVTQPGETGFLYPQGDVAACSRLVARLIAQPALAAQVGAAGRADVARWGWPAASKHLREVLYSRAITHQSAARRFRRMASRLAQRRAAGWALLRLLSSQPALHAATALIAGVFLAAVAAGAPGAAHAVVQVASSFDGVRAHVALALVIAAGGALPLVPMQPLALLAGYFFGVAQGTAVAWSGIVGASVAALACSKLFNGGHLLREMLPLGRARPFLEAQLRRVAAAAQAGKWATGALAVAALRLRPLAPFSLSNYLLAPVVSLPSYLGGTALGMLPCCVLYAAAGAAWRVHAASGRNLVRLAGAALDGLLTQQHGAVAAAAALFLLALLLLPSVEDAVRDAL